MRAARIVHIESLESRRLMSAGDAPLPATPVDVPMALEVALTPDPAPPTTPAPAEPAPIPEPPPVVRPSIASTNPANAATGVLRDAFLAAELFIPNGGIDPATLTHKSVYMYRNGGGAVVPVRLNTSAAGDVIVVRPLSVLEAHAYYTLVITDQLRDIAGNAFMPHTVTFGTSAKTSTTDTSIRFEKVALPATQGRHYLGLTTGPDGRLYAGTADGLIVRWDIALDGTLGAETIVADFSGRGQGERFVVGIAFDPASTRKKPVLWVTHTPAVLTDGPDFSGTLSRVSGKGLSVIEDKIIHLPRSTRDHFTNQLVFGPDGAIYFNQAGNNAMGAPDAGWGMRPERLLSAAILRVDTTLLPADRPLDVLTPDVGGGYDPSAANAPLTIYATGVRNAYDMVWHSNGRLYAPANGSAAGGATPAGPGVPGIPRVALPESDTLLRVEKGKYYGHPNPTRGEYVFNGGNPTLGNDPYGVYEYPTGIQPEAHWQQPILDFGPHQSPDGIIEYHGDAFGGKLDGALLIARYSGGDDILVVTLDVNGNATGQLTGIAGLTGFDNPLELAEHGSGNLYVSELGNNPQDGRITLLRPVPVAVSGPPIPDPRPPAEQRLVTKIERLATRHVLPLGNLDYVTAEDLPDVLASLKDACARLQLREKIGTFAQKQQAALAPMEHASLDKLQGIWVSLKSPGVADVGSTVPTKTR